MAAVLHPEIDAFAGATKAAAGLMVTFESAEVNSQFVVPFLLSLYKLRLQLQLRSKKFVHL